MEHDIELMKKRFAELAGRSYNKGIFTFTDFLTLAEQDALLSAKHPCALRLFGGCDGCERVMARFGDAEELGYDEPFPIVLIRLSPKSSKFADALTHRDFLGGLMSLGIDRSKVGDIFTEDNCGYIFVHESVAEYIKDSVDSIKHTAVKAELLDTVPVVLRPKTEHLDVNVASERGDAVIAAIFNLSRNESAALFSSGRVFVNSRAVENSSKPLADGDTVSVRGLGKFVYTGIVRETRKGRFYVSAEKYV